MPAEKKIAPEKIQKSVHGEERGDNPEIPVWKTPLFQTTSADEAARMKMTVQIAPITEPEGVNAGSLIDRYQPIPALVIMPPK